MVKQQKLALAVCFQFFNTRLSIVSGQKVVKIQKMKGKGLMVNGGKLSRLQLSQKHFSCSKLESYTQPRGKKNITVITFLTVKNCEASDP